MRTNLIKKKEAPKVGDIFSEESHYVVNKVAKDKVEFLHLESGKKVSLSNEYVANLLNTSDQYDNEVKVGKEDKKDGTPGIRTIFENIKSSEVFTVVFKKQERDLLILTLSLSSSTMVLSIL